MKGYKLTDSDGYGANHTVRYEAGKQYHDDKGIYFCKEAWCCEAEGNFKLKESRVFLIRARNCTRLPGTVCTYTATDIAVIKEITGKEKERLIERSRKPILRYFEEDGIPYEF